MRNDIISVGNRRLLKLAELLESLPPERFDFSQYVGDDYSGKSAQLCGSTACALGWATTMPNLRRLGLRLGRTLGSYCPVMTRPTAVRHYGHPDRVGAELFGLDPKDVLLLFFPDSDRVHEATGMYGLRRTASAKAVAHNIRLFVATSKRAYGRT
jgi:hypothetical protein